ncbi:MAG: DMT family transporter [Alphaproteobacteria bacterium]|nr:DMT family transporter [Alphaproteobacteria bacterium]
MPTRDLGLLLLINLIWAFAIVAASASLKHFPPLEFTWLRFIFISAMMVPWLRWQPGKMQQIFWIAITGGTLNFALLFLGLQMAGEVSTVAIASQLGVPFATIMSIVFLGEVVRWRRWTGIALSFAGVMVIGFDPRVIGYLDGFLVVVASAFVGSFSSILMRRIKDVPVFEMQALISTISWPFLLLLTLVFESGQVEATRTASLAQWSGIAYVALMSSMVAHAGFYYLIQRYEVSKVTPLTLLSPLFTVVLGVVLLGETLTWRIVIGGAITLAGVTIVSLRERTHLREPIIR